MKNFSIVFVLALMSLFARAAQAQDAPAPVVESPVEVKVGIYVLNIGNFNLSNGSFTVDFYLSFKSDRPFSPERFEFMNGRATSVDKMIDTPTEKFYRIQASLSQNIDFKGYPFDKHSLYIELEDKDNTTSIMKYVPDPKNSGIDPAVIIVGWGLDGWIADVKEHHYIPYDETYSRFTFNINISRAALTSFIKSFLPVFFMVFVALLSLLLTPANVTLRLSLDISTLLAAVMFHLNLTSTIPPVGYLTFADKIMIITYVILIAILTSGVALMRRTEEKDSVRAQKIYKYSLVILPVTTVVLYAVTFLFL